MSNTDVAKTVAVVKDKWPRRILIVLGSIFALVLLPKACAAIFSPNGGDIFDDYEVISTLSSPDGELNAVQYRYTYAELSSTGMSVWLLRGTAPAIGSTHIPDGEPAFTYLPKDYDIHWTWNSEERLELRLSGNAEIVTTDSPSDCFWRHAQTILCLHSPNVVVKKD